jgi:hypothetical protein
MGFGCWTERAINQKNAAYKEKRLKTLEVKFWSLAEKLNRPLGKQG